MRVALVLLVLASLAAAPAAAQAPREAAEPGAAFSFYGLRFGMTVEEVKKTIRTNEAGTDAVQPAHGLMYLTLAYDFRGRLSEIRASYERPGDRLREAALRQAIREKFQQPIAARWRSVSADIDESSNRAAISLVLIALDLRQEALDHFKGVFLESMK